MRRARMNWRSIMTTSCKTLFSDFLVRFISEQQGIVSSLICTQQVQIYVYGAILRKEVLRSSSRELPFLWKFQPFLVILLPQITSTLRLLSYSSLEEVNISSSWRRCRQWNGLSDRTLASVPSRKQTKTTILCSAKGAFGQMAFVWHTYTHLPVGIVVFMESNLL